MSQLFSEYNHGPSEFPTTLWTMVLHAGRSDSSAAHQALSKLCQNYWYPLYAFVRHRGYSSDDAQDLTQAFFVQLLEKQSLDRVSQERGRFRTFLLAALKNFLTNEWDKQQTLKRGGGQRKIAWEHDSAEPRYQIEPSHNSTPEKLFERQWALLLLENVLIQLREEYYLAGSGRLFDELKDSLTGNTAGYAEIAARLGRTEGAIKVAAHRLRQRYRDLLRNQIAQTVTDGEIEDELRYLMAALRGE
jgi:RNA polymerase sigma factor (sigma-70 family)